MSVSDRRARFRALHAAENLFVMPNPWEVGSARLLASCGFDALATTSAGLAWALGKPDQSVSRDELIAHVASLAGATPLPLNVDSERCYPDDPGGVSETVALLAEAGAAGFSIEDYDPRADRIDELAAAAQRVAVAVEAAHGLPDPLVVTARAENHIRGVDDLDDTIVRLTAYRDAGADVVYAPGLVDPRRDRGGRRGGRGPRKRSRPAERSHRGRARVRGSPARLHRRVARAVGLWSAARGGATAALRSDRGLRVGRPDLRRAGSRARRGRLSARSGGA